MSRIRWALAGGAEIIRQYLSAGLVDELQLHISPVLLGSGTRLFDQVDTQHIEMKPLRVIQSPAVTHMIYRVAS